MAEITLTDANNGEVIRVRQGDEITLGLPENATTGLPLARRTGRRARREGARCARGVPRPAGSSPQLGSGGIRKFRFVAKASGTARLELKHWREWEGEKSVIARFAVDITVTEIVQE